LKVKADDALVAVAMDNFSRHGILFVSPVPFPTDAHTECVISIPQVLSQNISCGMRVKYCLKKENSFVIGAAIDTITDQTWFNIFVEIHDFIAQR
jgi:PilZ domain